MYFITHYYGVRRLFDIYFNDRTDIKYSDLQHRDSKYILSATHNNIVIIKMCSRLIIKLFLYLYTKITIPWQ
jgi:hypothetical protein